MATIYKNGVAIRKGKNLRVLSDYARAHPPISVLVWPDMGGAHLTVTFPDNAHSFEHFESFGVACQWVRMKAARSGWPAPAVLCCAPHTVIRAEGFAHHRVQARIEYDPLPGFGAPAVPLLSKPWKAFDAHGTCFAHYATAAEALEGLRGKGSKIATSSRMRAEQADAHAQQINATPEN